MQNYIFIPGNVPSSKNSRIYNYKLKRSFPSSITTKYIKNTEEIFKGYKEEFLNLIKDLPYPLDIRFTFIRDSQRKFDLINAVQIIQDLMVKYEWIEDDNYTILRPFFGQTTVDKNNAGVIIDVYGKG